MTINADTLDGKHASELDFSSDNIDDGIPPSDPGMAPNVLAGLGLISLEWGSYVAPFDFSHFELWRSTNGVNFDLLTTTNTPQFIDENVLYTTTYYYKYRVQDVAARNSNYSPATAGVSPLKVDGGDFDTTPPATVSGLSLTTGVSLGADGSEYSWIRATWDANGESDMSHYEYRIKETGGNYIYGLVTANSFLFSPVRANILHYAGVRAIDVLNNKSGFGTDSNITSAKDTGTPAIPAGLTLIAGFKLIGLKWNQNVESDLSTYDVERSTTGAFAGEQVGLKPVLTHFFVDSDLAVATQYYYRIRAIDNSGNASNWTASANTTTLKVGSGEIAASTALIDQLFATQALVNELVVQLNNLGSTKILPGLIEVSGATSLANWRHGSDLTKIDGGDIYSNSVTANKVTVGSRNLSIQGIEISAQTPTANRLYWTAGVISYIKDDETTADVSITGTNVLWSTGTVYLYWVKDATTLSTTTTRATAFGANNIVLASYRGGTDLVVNYGRTIIDGSDIVTSTVTADRLSVTILSAIAADLGSVTAGNIRTAISGQRIDINYAAANAISWYNSDGTLTGRISGNSINFWNAAGSGNFELASGANPGDWPYLYLTLIGQSTTHISLAGNQLDTDSGSFSFFGDRVYVDLTNSRVGINNPNPLKPLHVGSAFTTNAIVIESEANNADAITTLQSAGDYSIGMGVYSQDLYFYWRGAGGDIYSAVIAGAGGLTVAKIYDAP